MIQEYQISKKNKEFTQDILKSGSQATLYEVNKKLVDFFTYNALGNPFVAPIHLEAFSTSNEDIINNFFKKAINDIECLYDVTLMQETALLNNIEKYKTYFLGLNKEIDELQYNSELLKEFIKKREVYYPILLTFYNLLNVNSYNEVEKNVFKTNCSFDFSNSFVTNDVISDVNSKLDIPSVISSIDILHGEKKLKYSGDINNIFDDNETSYLNINTDSTNGFADSLSFVIQFNDFQPITNIELKGYSLQNTDITILLSDDGTNFLSLETQAGKNYNHFNFIRRNIKTLKIKIQKNNYDYKNNDFYSYIFGFTNLSIYNNTYKTSGVLVSKTIEIKDIVSDFQIETIKYTPPLTQIDTFIGYENKDDSVEWFDVANSGSVDLNILKKEKIDLNYTSSQSFGDTFTDDFGNVYYKLHTLEEDSSINSIKLRAGHNQWIIERLKDNLDEKGIINLKDYKPENVTCISPLDITIPYIKCEKESNYFLLSTYVLTDKETIINDRFIDFNKEDELFDAKVIVNGKNIFIKNGKYNFKLKEGENSIKIFICLNNHKDISKLISHNFNILPNIKDSFSGKWMKRVSLSSFRNLSENNLNYFSTVKENNRFIIISKFNPNFIKKPSDPRNSDIFMNNSEYIRTFMTYKRLTPKKKAEITNKDGNSNIRIRFMAKLHSLSNSVTPIIKAVKVVGK